MGKHGQMPKHKMPNGHMMTDAQMKKMMGGWKLSKKGK